MMAASNRLMMGAIMMWMRKGSEVFWKQWRCREIPAYSSAEMICFQPSVRGLSSAFTQVSAALYWKKITTQAARNAKIESTLAAVSPAAPSSSSSSTRMVPICDGLKPAVIGWLGVCSGTVARGSAGAPAVRSGTVGAAPPPAPIGAVEVASRIVGEGAPPALGAPGVRSGMVGAGAAGLGRGGPPGTVALGGGAIGAVGAEGAIGGRGADGTTGGPAEGVLGGLSAAFKVTRTVSFLRGTLGGFGGSVSFGLMQAAFFRGWKTEFSDAEKKETNAAPRCQTPIFG